MHLSIFSLAAASQALAGDPTLWYVTRAAAISAYLMFALTVVLGLLRTTLRVLRSGGPGTIWLLDEAHQFSALLAVSFLLLHLATLVLDPVVPFSLSNIIIPVNEPYQAFATTLGVLALYTIALVALSSWFRSSISYNVWRGLHGFSFVAFTLVTLHGLLDGTDSGQGWMRLVYLGVTVVVLLFVVARLLATPVEATA
jgi:sulfoxide reductase heme-binding subunit YedZ